MSLISERCKLKPQWDITPHLSEWLSLINQKTCVGGDVETVESFALLVGMQIGAATVESNMELHQKIKNGVALWPSDSTAGNLSKGTQNTNSKEYKVLHFWKTHLLTDNSASLEH